MKKILIATAVLIGTLLTGFIIGRSDHFRDTSKMVQIDTTYVYDTVRYSKLQLEGDTYRLDIPRMNKVPVLIPVEKTDTVIKENKVYVSMEREYRYTETEDVQIWHSGIDSRIDSLNVFRKDMVISQTETTTLRPSPWRYSLDVRMDYGRMEVSYIKPGIGTEMGYGRLSVGAEAGICMNIEKSALSNPYFYWQVGVKYNILRR